MKQYLKDYIIYSTNCVLYFINFLQTLLKQRILQELMSKLWLFLDTMMFSLAAAGSYFLLTEQSKLSPLLLIIMFAYLFYFIRFRLGYYLGSSEEEHEAEIKSNKSAKSIKESDRKSENNEKKESPKITLDYLRMNMVRHPQLENSYHSHSGLNASKISNVSISRNHLYLNDSQAKDISLLYSQKSKSGNISLDDSIAKKRQTSSIQYLKALQKQQEQKAQYEKQKKSRYEQCIKKYEETIKKLNLTDWTEKNVRNIKNIKKVIHDLVMQFYRDNIENIKQMIKIVEESYAVKVVYENNEDILKENNGYVYKTQEGQKIDLVDLLDKVMKSKNCQLKGFPSKKLKYQQYVKSTNPSLNTEAQERVNKLLRLKENQYKLVSYFHSTKTQVSDAQTLLESLQLIKQRIQNYNSQDFQYQFRRPFHLDLEQYEQLFLIFNICRNKINYDFIENPLYFLEYKKSMLAGFVRKSKSKYLINQTHNSDYGLPHYDLLFAGSDKEKQEVYHCLFGQNNFYSLIAIFLVLLSSKQKSLVKQSKKLSGLVKKMLNLLSL